MSYEITLGFISGETLTYGVYQPDGTERTEAGTSLPEEGTTGYYHADNAVIQAGDIVIVKNGTVVVAYGEYKPEASAFSVYYGQLKNQIEDFQASEKNMVHNVFESGIRKEGRTRITGL